MREFVLGCRSVLWIFFAANLCVTLVLLSGGSFPVMSMVSCLLLFVALASNYSVFDRKGNLRETTTRQGHSDLVVPVDIARCDGSPTGLEHFDGKLHRGSGIAAGPDRDAVRTTQALGDSDDAEEPEPGKDKAVD